MKYFVFSVILLVLAAIIAGFFVVGSPNAERALRFDERRISDLQAIQSRIVDYWQTFGKLPANFEDTNDSIAGSRIYKDPETGVGYEYMVKGRTTFALCAVFSKESDPRRGENIYYYDNVYPQGTPDNWQHKAGRICFDRTIDETRYPINKVSSPGSAN